MTTAVLTGGCQCGRVRYAVSAVPDDVSVCHCRMCQKAVGGPFIALAIARPDQLTWTRGKPAEFRSSSIAKRLFCSDCGTPLAYVSDESGYFELTTGSFDEPAGLVPSRENGIESRLSWVDRLATLPGHTTENLQDGRNVGRIVSFQHPDHDTRQVGPRPIATPDSGMMRR